MNTATQIKNILTISLKKYDIEEAKIKFIDDEENFIDFDVDEMVELLDIII